MWFGIAELFIAIWLTMKGWWDKACELLQKMFDNGDDDDFFGGLGV